MTEMEMGLESVREYYGRVLKTNKDLQTNACCTMDSLPSYLRNILAEIHPEVVEKFYGCGSPFPLDLRGKTVLDLGSGSGRDCFLLSKLVGPEGQVIGVDMTDEQLAVANRHVDYHMKKFDFKKPNVRFIKGYIEDLETAGIATNSVDLVVSNCVINLSPNKARVFAEMFRVLRPGGEMYVSDVFASRRLPSSLAEDPVLLGECLGGAMYIEDFRRLLVNLGCNDYRLTTTTKINLISEEILRKVGHIDFYSLTVRAFKLEMEDRCEDFGQVAYYLGTIENAPNVFVLDDHHSFEKGRPVPVCSNTALMLTGTGYAKHFEVRGHTTTHFGLFDCAPKEATSAAAAVGACC